MVNGVTGPVNYLAAYFNIYLTKLGKFGGLINMVSATMQQKKRVFLLKVFALCHN